ncbi:sugar phosphate nucleotidyltransferase [Cohnella endophytica]|uniref:sugar phosphate nucleotidyltransferase n=1 Tax=Cohnella endophytica TaxID=2419778 RepID=UPI001314E38B|nr:sugar phosphate nucleotidyltransferase [Cohnella endophytica]
MKILLLSGGAGKRLWPLSSEILPKPFMKIIRNPSGGSVSMLQRTWGILARKFGPDNIFVVANRHHQAVLEDQLGPKASLILEPAQRDTFPAISLAASYLAHHVGANPDETVIVLPVDAYTEPSFYDLLTDLDRLIAADKARIGLIGVKPTHPSEKFGYVIPLPAPEASYYYVGGFHEKPDRQSALAFMQRNALWNGGVFAFKLNEMRQIVLDHNLPWSYEELYDRYDAFPRISFDYMVVEPEKNILCVAYEGKWTDLGTWSDMVNAFEPDNGNNVIQDDNCLDTYVINQLSIPIIVTGISNAIIAAGPDGILISDKNATHTIKPLVERLSPDSSEQGESEL